ncbi:MAG: phosphatase [Actinobacteria bacterium]|nr:phosphatase [Actinomycetota bacterium]
MDVIEAHARLLPPVDDRWAPRAYETWHLESALLEGKVAGPAAHPLDNVRGNIGLLLAGDPDKRFGMSFVSDAFGFERALDIVAEAAGTPIDHAARFGEVWIEPGPVLRECLAMGDRLAHAAGGGETVVIATGHPTGLALFYMEIGRLLAASGAKVLKPADGLTWKEPGSHHPRQIRYLDGVAMLTDKASAKHTHAPEAMERMLAEVRPDLVVADHGFAGAAIERGIDTVSVADVNDPALIVAKAIGRTEVVAVMDDNVDPGAYWPCFQAIASRF